MKKFEKIIQTEDFVAFDFCSLVFAVIFVFWFRHALVQDFKHFVFWKVLLGLFVFPFRDFVFRPSQTKWDF